jgi:probable phosphoglycerate mutase
VLILVRHGRTAANAAGLLQGRLDNPLDPVGEGQAAAIAATLGRVDRVITSPLQRARSTAEAIGGDVVVDERWVELDYGLFDGQAQGDLAADVWDHWRADPQYAPPGGESLAELDRRVVEALEELSQEAQHRDVVVVSHVSPIKAAIAWAVGSSVGVMSWRCRLDVASICRLAVTPRGPVMISFNETAHLAR